MRIKSMPALALLFAWTVGCAAPPPPTPVPPSAPDPTLPAPTAIAVSSSLAAAASPTVAGLISRQQALDWLRLIPPGTEIAGGRVDFFRIDRKEARLATWGEWRRLDAEVHGPPDVDRAAPVWVVVAQGEMLRKPKPGTPDVNVGGVVLAARSGQVLASFALPRPWPAYWDQLPDRSGG